MKWHQPSNTTVLSCNYKMLNFHVFNALIIYFPQEKYTLWTNCKCKISAIHILVYCSVFFCWRKLLFSGFRSLEHNLICSLEKRHLSFLFLNRSQGSIFEQASAVQRWSGEEGHSWLGISMLQSSANKSTNSFNSGTCQKRDGQTNTYRRRQGSTGLRTPRLSSFSF